jgi:hypothetical protein
MHLTEETYISRKKNILISQCKKHHISSSKFGLILFPQFKNRFLKNEIYQSVDFMYLGLKLIVFVFPMQRPSVGMQMTERT